MDMHRNLLDRRRGRRRSFALVLVGLVVATLGAARVATAELIFDSMRYDGHVRNGSTTGIEEHHTSASATPQIAMHPLPATNAPLDSPLEAANDLQVALTYSPAAPLFGDTSERVEVWIRDPTSLDTFANDLDDTLGFPPVEFETFVYLEDLAANEKIVLHHIGIEGDSSVAPYEAPASCQASPEACIFSGTGSPADPLHLLIGLDAEQPTLSNRNGQVKIQLYYGRMVVPEPATVCLAGLAAVAVGGLVHRWRRR